MASDRRLNAPKRSSTGSALVEVLYPRRCAACGRRGCWVCEECEALVALIAPPWCARCGEPIARGHCRCELLSNALAWVRSALPYDGWVGAAIRSFKYHQERARTEHLAATLAPLVGSLAEPFVLTPVPLHRKRERTRGYNQATLLAEAIARETETEVESVLVRARETPQQVGLDAEARRRNVHDAFAVQPGARIDGRRFVLVDDVLTTGSTLGACAESLAAAGAAWVGAVTVAREG